MADKTIDKAKEADNLLRILGENLEHMSDDELLAEAVDDFGSVDAMVSAFDGIVSKAAAEARRNRLTAARSGYQATREQQQTAEGRVFQFSSTHKRAVIARANDMRHGQITMAARNEQDSEADLDKIIQDLIDLGAIDQEGNPK